MGPLGYRVNDKGERIESPIYYEEYTLEGADIEKGKKLFVERCAHCHTTNFGGADKNGPNLHGLIGAHIGQVSKKYNYSAYNKHSIEYWNLLGLDRLLFDPQRKIPGIKMDIRVKDRQDRKDIIAYLAKSTAPK